MSTLLPLVLALLAALVVGAVIGAACVLAALRSPAPRVPTASLAAERAAVDALVRPVNDTLRQVSVDLARAERERAAANASLQEQLRLTALGTDALRDTTGRLASALRRPDVRGRWGEMQLRRLVESSGLLPHVHFDEQASTRDDVGDVLRPDLVVHLADGKDVVVDAKVPLSAYLDAMEASDDTASRQALARHAADVVAHVDRLSAKEYWRRHGSPEFVVLFLPAEALLMHALEQRPDLLEHAFARDVVIATPTTLLALLRTVGHTWRQDAAVRNVREVQGLARELHGRISTFAAHLARLGTALDSAVGHYNSSVGSLESRVLVSARRLATMGLVDHDPDDPDAGLAEPRLVLTATRSPKLSEQGLDAL